MEILGIVLIVYGVLCIFIGLFKLPLVWQIKKIQTMKKLFKGDRNLQLFLIAWGLIVGFIGMMIR
jgi:hypothetical protein